MRLLPRVTHQPIQDRLRKSLRYGCLGLIAYALVGVSGVTDSSGTDAHAGFGISMIGTAQAAKPAAGTRDDKTTKRPRNEASLTGGTLIMLDTMWIPVDVGNGQSMPVGLTPYLEPHDDHMEKACYRTPWVAEALIMYLYENPITRTELAQVSDSLRQQELMALAEMIAGPGVFKSLRLGQGLPERLPREDQTLSLVCK